MSAADDGEDGDDAVVLVSISCSRLQATDTVARLLRSDPDALGSDTQWIVVGNTECVELSNSPSFERIVQISGLTDNDIPLRIQVFQVPDDGANTVVAPTDLLGYADSSLMTILGTEEGSMELALQSSDGGTGDYGSVTVAVEVGSSAFDATAADTFSFGSSSSSSSETKASVPTDDDDLDAVFGGGGTSSSMSLEDETMAATTTTSSSESKQAVVQQEKDDDSELLDDWKSKHEAKLQSAADAAAKAKQDRIDASKAQVELFNAQRRAKLKKNKQVNRATESKLHESRKLEAAKAAEPVSFSSAMADWQKVVSMISPKVLQERGGKELSRMKMLFFALKYPSGPNK
jgi:hypothetical protein